MSKVGLIMSLLHKMEFATKALILQNGRFLALERSVGDGFELPGGRMEFGETFEETLQRETLEETGLSVIPIKIIDTWNWLNEAKSHQIVGVVYLCQMNSTLVSVKLSDEHENFEWFEVKDFSKMNCFWKPILSKFDWDELTRIDF